MKLFSFSTSCIAAALLAVTTFAPHSNAAVMLGGSPDPSEASLQLWLKADALALSQSDPVNTWTASAGTSPTAFTGVPTYISGANSTGFNGKPVVRFDGVNDTMLLTNVNTAVTVILVSKFNSPTHPTEQALFNGNPFNNSGSDTLGPWDYAGISPGETVPNGPDPDHGVFGNTGDNYWVWFHNAIYTYSASLYDTNAHISLHEAELTSGTSFNIRVFMDGTPEISTSVNNGGAGLELKTLGGGYGFDFANADIAEVLVYDRLLTSGETSALQSYLTERYVPEPASLGLLAMGGLALLRRHRRAADRMSK